MTTTLTISLQHVRAAVFVGAVLLAVSGVFVPLHVGAENANGSCVTPWGNRTVADGESVFSQPYFANGVFSYGVVTTQKRCDNGTWVTCNWQGNDCDVPGTTGDTSSGNVASDNSSSSSGGGNGTGTVGGGSSGDQSGTESTTENETNTESADHSDSNENDEKQIESLYQKGLDLQKHLCLYGASSASWRWTSAGIKAVCPNANDAMKNDASDTGPAQNDDESEDVSNNDSSTISSYSDDEDERDEERLDALHKKATDLRERFASWIGARCTSGFIPTGTASFKHLCDTTSDQLDNDDDNDDSGSNDDDDSNDGNDTTDDNFNNNNCITSAGTYSSWCPDGSDDDSIDGSTASETGTLSGDDTDITIKLRSGGTVDIPLGFSLSDKARDRIIKALKNNTYVKSVQVGDTAYESDDND